MVLSAIVLSGVCGEYGKAFYGFTLLRVGVLFSKVGVLLLFSNNKLKAPSNLLNFATLTLGESCVTTCYFVHAAAIAAAVR